MGLEHNFRADIEAISAIDAVPTILNVVCRVTGMGFAAVARVTEERWICCAVHDDIQFGLQPGGELKVETTICHEVRQSRDAVVIDHVAEDQLYCQHHTPAMYGFQSYISMPIFRNDGSFFGTLCAIDPRPHRLKNPETIGMFKLFAELIAFHLDTSERLATSEASLFGERKTSELREQFIAVLGHDLRNPLASIDAGTRLLQKTPLNEKAQTILQMMQASVARMSGLITNVMDFARGRLGGGLNLDRRNEALGPVLDQVVAEFRMSQPDRAIETKFSLAAPVDCDRNRIARLASNLIGNALMYGKLGAPVRVQAVSDDAAFTLSVSNPGEPIPSETLERLFLPFARGAVQPNQQGLGLGLYISSEIARAHGGTIEVASTAEETRFTFRMARDSS
ncbi:MAG: GAF domain-containing sensor histidine kinase [Alphaproteobacteria bacterium]